MATQDCAKPLEIQTDWGPMDENQIASREVVYTNYKPGKYPNTTRLHFIA
jgi:hypothetical protein